MIEDDDGVLRVWRGCRCFALSTKDSQTVTEYNADDFEVLTNKKSGPCGEEQKKGPWDNM